MSQVVIFNICTLLTPVSNRQSTITFVVIVVALLSIIIILVVVFALWKLKKNSQVASNHSSQDNIKKENQGDQNKINQNSEKELPAKVHGIIYSIFPEDAAVKGITPNLPTVIPQPTPTIPSSESLSSSCVVYMTEESCFCLIPCGHMCVCRKCSSYLTANNQNCPLCRQAIQGCLKVYKN